MKTVLPPPLALMLLIGFTNAIRFVSKGFELLDPQTGRVILPRGRGESFLRFAPPITDEIDGGSRYPRQIFQGYDSGFFSSGSSQPHFRQERKVIPFRYGSSRYQSSADKTSYAHKKRQRNPYYGRRKKRSPEPYTLIDPWTGRTLNNKIQEKPKRRQNNFLFGLPSFDFFNEGHGFLKENVRLQRGAAQQPSYDPYVSTNGVPLYRYRNKHPHGYGRKKREAQKGPWILLDPITGRTKAKTTGIPKNTGSFDPLEQQFQSPGLRSERRPTTVYLSDNGVPLYKYRNKYPAYRG